MSSHFGGSRAITDRALPAGVLPGNVRYRGGDRAINARGYGTTGAPPVDPNPHLLNGLTSYWKFDETSGTVFADSVGSNNLNINAGINSQPGLIGHAMFNYQLNGSGSIASNPSLKPTGSFTFSTWVEVYTGNNAFYLYKGDNAFLPTDFQLYYAGGNLGWAVGGVGPAGIPASQGPWYHIVAWYDAPNSIVGIRVNDSIVGTASASKLNSDYPLCLGSYVQNGVVQGPTGGWQGIEDETAFWNSRLLSAVEKTALYNGGLGLPLSSFTT